MLTSIGGDIDTREKILDWVMPDRAYQILGIALTVIALYAAATGVQLIRGEQVTVVCLLLIAHSTLLAMGTM